jgi:hypothetical protein
MQSVWGEKRNVLGFWWGNLKERDHVGRRHIWDDAVKRHMEIDVKVWTGFPLFSIWTNGRCCAHHSKSSGSIQCKELLD